METGSISDLSEIEIIKTALDHMAEALCWTYETKTDKGQALCWMLDQAIKYGTVIVHGGDVLSASANYEEYEESIVPAAKGNLRVVKIEKE